MTDTIRERILQELSMILQTVVRARGYNTDIGQRIYRARKAFAESECPAISLVDDAEEATRGTFGGIDVVMDVFVQAHFLSVSAFSEEANSLVGEIMQEVLAEDHSLGGLCSNVEYTGMTPTYPDEGSKSTALNIQFRVHYTISDPYTALNP